MKAIISFITFPMIIMNSLGLIIAIGWLLYAREWGILGYGIVLLVLGTTIIGIAVLPGMILAIPAIALINKGRIYLSILAGIPSNIYYLFVYITWIAGVFLYFTNKLLPNEDLIIPMALFAYGISTTPFIIILTKGQIENPTNTINALFSQTAALAAVVALTFFDVSSLVVLILIAVIMSFTVLINTIFGYYQLKNNVFL